MRNEQPVLQLALSVDVLSSLPRIIAAQTHELLYPYKVYISLFIPAAQNTYQFEFAQSFPWHIWEFRLWNLVIPCFSPTVNICRDTTLIRFKLGCTKTRKMQHFTTVFDERGEYPPISICLLPYESQSASVDPTLTND